IQSKDSNVATGARPYPAVPDPSSIYDPEIYDRAVEHLRDLFRSEGYIFAEISEPTVLRAGCGVGSKPGECQVLPLPPLPDVCKSDLEQLPQEALPIPKSFTCVADAAKGKLCAPTVTIVIPVNPGPRSILWDVAFDGTKALSPELLGGPKVAGQSLRLGQPLSLQDVEQARKAVLHWYRDEGYAFASVRATLEYSPDKSRARARFIVAEGELVVIENIYVEGHKRTLESLIRARLLIAKDGVYRLNLVDQPQERLAQLGVFSSVSIGLINPTIPAKKKNVIVTVVERPPQHIEVRPGFSTGEGIRYYSEYGYSNLFGYAVSLDFRLKISYQPFIGCRETGERNEAGEKLFTCGTSSFYGEDVVRRWNTLTGLDRFPRRISLGVTLPHSPIFGATVRTSVELVNSLDLFRDFKLDRYTPVLTFTYNPIRWFTAIFAGDVEYNKFLLFDKGQIERFLATNQRFSTLLRVPDGNTGVAATRATFTFDFRDNRLGATKNGFISITNEYVRSILLPPDIVAPLEGGGSVLVTPPRQEFLHITGATGVYFKLDALWKKPVLAIELQAGGNFNVFSCASNPDRIVGAQTYRTCDTYPDRLFYLGGVDSNRGFLPGQMLPQDAIDEVRERLGGLSAADSADAVIFTPRGGNVFINPRIELRVPAFKWGGFVIFLDAANSWRDKGKFLRDRDGKFAPWRLRYSVGPGLSIDTPVGPIALDFGFNLSRYEVFNEPPFAFNFSIGRF
ncbi:MAG: BamA/TamA family outer membrane protein, partial [Polyangiales bacterium]